MGKAAKNMVALLGPAVVVGIFYNLMMRSQDIRPLLTALYLLTATWTAVFIRLRLGRLSLLPVSYLASMLGPFILEAQRTGLFRYLGCYFILFFYSLPWTVLALVAAVIIFFRQRRKKYFHLRTGRLAKQ